MAKSQRKPLQRYMNKYEGFETQNQNQNEDISSYNELTQQYDSIVRQIKTVQQSMNQGSLANISRTGTNNPYRNNTVSVSGAIGNVTGQGVYKWYNSWDTINATQGKNGCPVADPSNMMSINQTLSDPSSAGQTINSSPNLLVGTPMKSGQSCGYEGSNVYASTLIDNPTSSYIGCYNASDGTNPLVSVIPKFTSNTSQPNGFQATQSSSYTNNVATYGGWAAFDQNPNTYWHSNTLYNSATGAYQGAASVNSVKGEYIQINMPSPIKVLQYSIAPRLDLITVRSPNSWYLFGTNNGSSSFVQIDRQVSQQFVSSTPRTFTISTPSSYSTYILVVDMVGNGDVTDGKDSVQISELAFYTNDPATNTSTLNPISYMTYDKCQQYALDNGYTYFGLQDLQSDGRALCGVSNDLAKIQGYGAADTVATAIPIWSSNTSGKPIKRMEVRNDGSIALVDTTDGTVYWSSPGKPTDCVNGGFVNSDTIQGSYGANCIGKPKGVDCKNPSKSQSYSSNGILGNLNGLLKNKAQLYQTNKTANWSYNPLGDWTGGDPAYCCNKMVDYTYQCGASPFKSGRVQGGAISFDCSREVANCVFFLVLQQDGNMCVYRGQDPSSNKGGIWCSATNGKALNTNANWVASKSKYGRNYLKSGETLLVGEWLGSDDGSLKLILNDDGNLVLYASDTKAGCQPIRGKNANAGTVGVNAVYQLTSKGNKQSLGKVAYIDADSNLREYPDSMLTYSNDYNLIQGYNSGGNDITSSTVDNLDGCKVACSNLASCAGFVYQETTKTCWLKNKDMYPKGDKQAQTGLTLGVRKPALNEAAASKCNKNIYDIDTVRYDNYPKGTAMDANLLPCEQKIVNTQQSSQLEDLNSQLYVVGQQISSKMNELYEKDRKIYEKLGMNEQQFKTNLEKYRDMKNVLDNEKQSLFNLHEGMQLLSDIEGKEADTSLRVIQENYSYVFWSLLALGVLTVTVSTMRK